MHKALGQLWPAWSSDRNHPPQRGELVVDVVIPALNEEESLGLVLAAIPDGWVRRVVVADNGSTDHTADVARSFGARVVHEPRRGYGSACLAGLAALREDPPDVVVFLDADFSDHADELPLVLAPILAGEAEVVIGSRTLGEKEPGAMLPQAIFGNWLATSLVRLLYGYTFTDLGPFRAIEWRAFERLGMVDQNFGWTVELQIKAAQQRMRCYEVPVSYRKRVGVSKITGTIQGSVRAGYKILYTIFRYAVQEPGEGR
jgi:glycosyltransferase involved in cell wall biosynthesis